VRAIRYNVERHKEARRRISRISRITRRRRIVG